MLTSHTMRAVREDHEIKRDIAPYARNLWRMAVIVVCMIIISGVLFRVIHVKAEAHKETRRAAAQSPR